MDTALDSESVSDLTEHMSSTTVSTVSEVNRSSSEGTAGAGAGGVVDVEEFGLKLTLAEPPSSDDEDVYLDEHDRADGEGLGEIITHADAAGLRERGSGIEGDERDEIFARCVVILRERTRAT